MIVKKNRLNWFFLNLIILIMSFFIANRAIYVGTDTRTYTVIFSRLASCKCIGESELGFELFIYPMTLLGFSPQIIFFIISFFIFIITFLVIHKLVDYYFIDNEKNKFKIKLTVFFILLFVPFYFQVHVNAIRQGMSLMVLLLAFTYVINQNYKVSFWLALASIGFHYSAILIVPFYLVFFHSKVSFRKVFLICIFLFLSLVSVYLTGYSEYIVRVISNFISMPIWESVSSYGQDSGYKVGVRYDFLAFTLFLIAPVVFFSLRNEKFNKLSVFLFSSSFPFLLLGWGAYSNRYIFNTWIYAFIFLIVFLVIKIPKLSRFPYFIGFFSIAVVLYKVYFYV